MNSFKLKLSQNNLKINFTEVEGTIAKSKSREN